jgi:streptogramin lyase
MLRCLGIFIVMLLIGMNMTCTAMASVISTTVTPVEGPVLNAFTVTYNGNGSTGGSVPIDNNIYHNGATVTVLGNTGALTRLFYLYSFAGWNTVADGSGTSYQPGSTFIMPSASVTLYAQWTRVIPKTFLGPIGYSSASWTDITYNGGFSGPDGAAVDGSGNVYVADSINNKIMELASGSTSWTDITGNGGFYYPYAVAMDGAGNLYATDVGNKKIKELASGSTSWTDITGSGGGFSYPYNVAADGAGNVYVTDYSNRKIMMLASGSTSWTDITYNGGFSSPSGVTVDGSGNVYAADVIDSKIKELASGSTSWTDITGNGGFTCPNGMAVDGAGNVYAVDTGNNKIKELERGQASWTDITGNGGLNDPEGMAVGKSGNVYVTNYGNCKIYELVAQTLPTTPRLLNPGLENNINNALSNLNNTSGQPQVATTPQGIQVYVNGTLVPLAVAPMLVDGRYMVQMRPIFEALGADPPKWDKATKTITDTMGSTTIKLKIGSTTAYKNDVEYTLASPPMLYSTGYTLVPARFISWAFGYNIKFDPTDNQIDITSNS